MIKKSIRIKILAAEKNFIKIKVPFTRIPIKMDYSFFIDRIKMGYFKVTKTHLKKWINDSNKDILASLAAY